MVILNKDVIDAFQTLSSSLPMGVRLSFVISHLQKLNHFPAEDNPKNLKLPLRRCWEKRQLLMKNATEDSDDYKSWLQLPLSSKPLSPNKEQEKKGPAPGRPMKRLSEVGNKSRSQKLAPIIQQWVLNII